MKNLPIIFLVFSLFFASSCGQNKQEWMPGINLPQDEMNKTLRLSAPSEQNSFKIGDTLSLVLENYSDTPIILPQDYGVRIFQPIDENWEAVENGMEYGPGKEVVKPNSQPYPLVFVPVFPSVFSDHEVTIRIVVVGNYSVEQSEQLGKEVGAYFDVTLNPQ